MTKEHNLEAIYYEKRAYFVRVIARRLGDVGAAEEIVQDAFLHVAEAARKQTIDNPEGYLMRAAINLSTDWLRQDASRRRRERNWVEAQYSLHEGVEVASPAPGADQIIAAQDEFHRLEKALGDLSPPVRRAFTLHKIEGLSQQETATRMGLSRSTVEKHIMKAMRRLVDAMSDGDENHSVIEEKRPPIRQPVERSRGT